MLNAKMTLGLLVAAILISGCSQQRAPTPDAMAGTLTGTTPGSSVMGGQGPGSGITGQGQGQGQGSGYGPGGYASGGANVVGGGQGQGGFGQGQGGFGQGQGGFGQGQGGFGQGQGGQGGFGQGQFGTNMTGSAGGHALSDLNDPNSPLFRRIVYFDFDQSRIKPEDRVVLDAHAALLSRQANLRVRLEGHADERGSREYNVALSERRGYAVRDYLAARGVRPQQVQVVGFGEELPAALGQNEAAWRQNRRVEIVYTGE